MVFFISYRHDDGRREAEQIYVRLGDSLPDASVFLDRGKLRPGERYREVIREHLVDAKCCFVVIGTRWLDILRERLDSPGPDLVAEEVRIAHERGLTIVPVLVGGAAMITPGQLEQSFDRETSPHLFDLCECQAVSLSEATFIEDSDKIVREARAVYDRERERERLARRESSRRRLRRLGVVVASLLLLAPAAWLLWPESAPTKTEPYSVDDLSVAGGLVRIPVEVIYAGRSGEFLQPIPVQTMVSSSAYELPDDLAPARKELEAEQERAVTAGRPREELRYDGGIFCVQRWHLHPPSDPSGPMPLLLEVTRAGYFDYLVAHRLSKELVVSEEAGRRVTGWEKYVERVPFDGQPNGQLPNYFGVSLTVVTKDGYAIMHRRSSRTGIAATTVHVGVAEGTLAPDDASEAPSRVPYGTARRGLKEELCQVGVDETSIRFLALIYSRELAQFDLLGLVRLSRTKDEVRGDLAACRDNLVENNDVFFVPFNGRAVAELMRDETSWSPFAAASVLLALYSEFGVKQVDADFAGVFDDRRVELRGFQFESP